MVEYQTLITEVLVPVFAVGGNVALFMGIASKLINMLIKAFTKGELIV